MADALPADEIVLSVPRRAYLAPKLRALLDELSKLTALETPNLEPATARPAGKERDDARR